MVSGLDSAEIRDLTLDSNANQYSIIVGGGSQSGLVRLKASPVQSH